VVATTPSSSLGHAVLFFLDGHVASAPRYDGWNAFIYKAFISMLAKPPYARNNIKAVD
jgi:hypothetical protein